MRIRAHNLRRTILEAVLEEEIRLSQDSVDDQIDSLLLSFEKDCAVEDEMSGPPMEGLVSLSALDMMLEAPGDEDEEEPEEPEPGVGGGETPPPEGEEEEPEDLTVDKDDLKVDSPADPPKPKIDIGKFAGKVSRLAVNHVNIFDIPIVIANRAYNYLQANYNQDAADEFAEIMERDFEIPIERESGAEPREFPMAVGAAASGLAGG